MKFKTIAIWIRVILMGFALCGIGLFAFAIPDIGHSFATANREFAGAYLPWMIFLWIAAVPCFAVLVIGWLIAGHIGRGDAFSAVNSRLLTAVAILSAVDSAYFLVGNIVLLFLNMNHLGIVLLSMFVVFIGAAISVAAAALARLTANAAEIRDENAMTI